MAPREVELPGTWPTAQPLRRRTVNTIKDNARYAHPSTDDTIEAHYSDLGRLRPHPTKWMVQSFPEAGVT